MKSVRLLQLSLIKLFTKARFWIGVVFIFLYIRPMLTDLSTYCAENDIKTSAYILPHLLSPAILLSIFGFVIVLLFSDAPFTEEDEIYKLSRSGRPLWLISKMLYILATSIIFFITMFIITLIFLFPNFSFANVWGDVLNVFKEPIVMLDLGLTPMPINSIIIDSYSPIQALLYSGMFFIFASFTTGTIMFVVNLYTNRVIGSSVGIFFVFFDYFVRNFGGSNSPARYLSPFTWVDISGFSNVNYPTLPSFEYAVIASIVLNLVLWITAYYKFGYSDVNTIEAI